MLHCPDLGMEATPFIREDVCAKVVSCYGYQPNTGEISLALRDTTLLRRVADGECRPSRAGLESNGRFPG